MQAPVVVMSALVPAPQPSEAPLAYPSVHHVLVGFVVCPEP